MSCSRNLVSGFPEGADFYSTVEVEGGVVVVVKVSFEKGILL